MSVFGNIMSSIFAGAAPASPAGAAPPPVKPASPAAPTPAASSPSPSPPSGAGAPGSAEAQSGAAASPPRQVDIAAVMDKLADASPEDLDWRTSIVDLMKLLKLDSSLTARKQLASELHYTGSTKDTAAMNMWLHREVMLKLAENGGKVPAELKH